MRKLGVYIYNELFVFWIYMVNIKRRGNKEKVGQTHHNELV